MTRSFIISTLALALAGCGGDADNKTATKLDAIEVQPGTISDSMILLNDARSDGTAIDNSDSEASAKTDSNASATEESGEADTEGEGDVTSETEGETISGSVAKKAAPEPAKN